jgi:hypothetical protein
LAGRGRQKIGRHTLHSKEFFSLLQRHRETRLDYCDIAFKSEQLRLLLAVAATAAAARQLVNRAINSYLIVIIVKSSVVACMQ